MVLDDPGKSGVGGPEIRPESESGEEEREIGDEDHWSGSHRRDFSGYTSVEGVTGERL